MRLHLLRVGAVAAAWHACGVAVPVHDVPGLPAGFATKGAAATAILLELGHSRKSVEAAAAAAAAAAAGGGGGANARTSLGSSYNAQPDPVLGDHHDGFGTLQMPVDGAQRVAGDRAARSKAAASKDEAQVCKKTLNAWLGSCLY